MNDSTQDRCQASQGDCSAGGVSTEAVFRPKYRSSYSDSAWEVSVQLPGVGKEQVEVTVENEILEISATRRREVPETWRPLGEYDAERRYQLRLDVGPEVDPAGVSASLNDGVLLLTLPLREEVKPQRIVVQ